MIKKLIFSVIFCNLVFTNSSLDYYLHIYSANRLSDGSMIDIPFRLADIDFIHDKDSFSIQSSLSLEHNPEYSNLYVQNSSSYDFFSFDIDLRELYVKWYFDIT